jgi:hypothetical protein
LVQEGDAGETGVAAILGVRHRTQDPINKKAVNRKDNEIKGAVLRSQRQQGRQAEDMRPGEDTAQRPCQGAA